MARSFAPTESYLRFCARAAVFVVFLAERLAAAPTRPDLGEGEALLR
jgi:hypothetical protein